MLSTSRIRALALSALLAATAALTAAPASAAPRKAKPSSQTAKAAPETVYVQVTPPRAPEARAAEAAPAPRRPERSFSGLTRDFAQAYGLYAGFYNAEVLGSTPYGTLFWDLYPRGQPYFFQFTAGGGTAQSDFSRSVVGADEFENNWLATFEALGGIAYTGLSQGEGRGGGLFPYFVAGITSVYQGGVPNVGGVIGFGNRMSMPFMGKGSLWALNYGIRDHIYSQKLRSEPSLTQNIVLLIGTQKYF